MQRSRTFFSTAVFFISFICMLVILPAKAGNDKKWRSGQKTEKSSVTLYGQASFYAAKFQGRRTASGDKFDHSRMTAACNSLPLNTWIKVTNLKNGKSVIVKTNDRLHVKTGRLVDLTKAAAEKLGFVKAGLTRVRVELLDSRDIK